MVFYAGILSETGPIFCCFVCVCLPTVNVTDCDLSNSLKTGILYLEDDVDKASLTFSFLNLEHFV